MLKLFTSTPTMKRRILCYILMASFLLSILVCVMDSKQGTERMLRGKVIEYKEALRGGMTRIGSTPPRCEHKCGGCIPCNPIQIPTNKHLLGAQYANYQPEGWKCKCGNYYFNP